MLKQTSNRLFSGRGPVLASLLALTAAYCLALSPVFAARPQNSRSSSAKDVAGDLSSLMRPLYGVQLIDAGKTPAQAQEFVIHHLTDWMTGGGFRLHDPAGYAPDVRVRMQLEQYFSKLQYPIFGSPVVFAAPWNGGTLIGAMFTLGWSDFDRVNAFALYESKGGVTRRAAAGSFFSGPEMQYALLPPSPAGAFRFIIYGNRLGKSQPRLDVALYSFDGRQLQKLWQQEDLYDGKITVAPKTVTLRYLIESEYVQAVQQGQWPDWHEDVYRVTPQGVALETERLTPFKSAS